MTYVAAIAKDDYKVSGELKLPHHLDHKPVYAMPYEPFDGIHKNKTDAKYLSVGFAQWNQNGNKEISAKVMRYGNQWSPQAEELPLHRPIDLSILIAKALFDADDEKLVFRGGTFLDQDCSLFISKETCSSEVSQAFDDFIKQNGSLIKDRLNSLCDVLLDLRRRNKI